MSNKFMRIISPKALREFRNLYPASGTGLQIWEKRITSRRWANSNEIKAAFSGADPVGNNRIVFNINHNDSRLIVIFRYKIQLCYIRFVGTHEEYDKIDNVSLV